MPNSIIGIPTSRVSDGFIRQRMMNQVQSDQIDMFRLQMQLSTGYRFQAPSEDPTAAMRVISLQSLIEQKTQIKANLTTNQSYLTATDSALGNVSTLVSDARSTALGVLGTTATDMQRAAAAQQISQSLQQLTDTANQQFRGRYLFAGSTTLVRPFEYAGGNYVSYQGNEGRVASFSDINQLFTTNVNGVQAFGAISSQVQGLDLQPVLTYGTKLADLHNGAGVTRGSIAVSDGHSTSIVDISGADSMADVAALIRSHPPTDRSLEVEVTSSGLVIRLNPSGLFNPATDKLAVREVGGGTTAAELGILRPNGVGQGPLVGDPLDPTLDLTTSTGDILGTRATAWMHFGGADSDLILTAKQNGTHAADGSLLNGFQVSFVDDGPPAGAESVVYTPGDATTAGSIVVHIALGLSRAAQVRDVINNTAGLPFTAEFDPINQSAEGRSTIDKLITTSADGGGGTNLDQGSGLKVVNQGKTYTINNLGPAKTVEDLLNALNGAGAGVLAEINLDRTGVNLRSRVSGADFTVGENGGTTASQLGLRSYADSTWLSSLNYGRGVQDYIGDLATATPATDFTITAADGTKIDVDLDGATTIGAVRAKINALGAGKIRADLISSGNGLSLVDISGGAGNITVARAPMSSAAIDLGLIPQGQVSITSAGSTLNGRDTNPLETGGPFNALLRLQRALERNDNAEAERAIELLDGAVTQLNFTRAEVGARSQAIEMDQLRLATDQIDLKAARSDDYDADLAEVISNFTARQIAYQASLQAAGKIMQQSLLNYL